MHRVLFCLGLAASLLWSCAGFDARRLYLEGQRLERAGRLDRAAGSYRLAVREDPNEEHTSALERVETVLFRTHLREAKEAEASGAFEIAAEHWAALRVLRPADERIAARAHIAELRLNGNADELWEASRRLLERARGNRDIIRVVAEIQARVLEDSVKEAWVSLRAGERERAFLAFERVGTLEPGHPDLERTEARRLISEVLEERGDQHAASGEWAAAKAAYRRAHQVSPRSDLEHKRRRLHEEAELERKRLLRARALRAGGRVEEALSEYERLVSPAPETRLHREIKEVRGEVLARRRRSAESLLVRGEVERALNELEKNGAALGGLSFESRKRAVELLLEEARSAGDAGEKIRSAGRLKSALDLAEPPAPLGSVLSAAIADLERGSSSKAMARFAEARSMEPRSKLARTGHDVSRRLSAQAKAVEGRELAAKDPYRAHLAFRAAAELDPDSPHLENNASRLRPRAARALVQRALESEGRGQPGHAFVFLERALELEPEQTEAKEARARIEPLLRAPSPPVASLSSQLGGGDAGLCPGVEEAWNRRLAFYLSRTRKLPFALAEDGDQGPITLRSTIESCGIDSKAGGIVVRVEIESSGLSLFSTTVESPAPAPARGGRPGASLSVRRDETITHAAAKVVRVLRGQRETVERWTETRARAQLQAGEPEPLAQAYAALRLAQRGPAPDPALVAAVRDWLAANVR